MKRIKKLPEPLSRIPILQNAQKQLGIEELSNKINKIIEFLNKKNIKGGKNV